MTIYKILVTTVASRPEAISVDTKVIDFPDRFEALKAIKNINEDQRDNGASRNYDQRALALNFNSEG
jgi:hypothetical protein